MQPRDEVKEVLSGQRIDGLETRNVTVLCALVPCFVGNLCP